VARRWRYKDGGGEIGLIASVTQPFCGDCSRARLSAEGKLYTCLFATEGHDLRRLFQAGASDDEIKNSIEDLWKKRMDRYSEERNGVKQSVKKIEMSYIGG
jgi:cyclic pyranopterin phosphate synthase